MPFLSLFTLAFVPSSLSCALPLALPPAQKMVARKVADGFIFPVDVVHPPGDDRLFVVEQVSGLVLIVKAGVVQANPYLDVSSKIGGWSGEQGFLGMTFHLNYAQNGLCYVNYTDPTGNNVIEEYQVSATNPDIVDPTSARVLLYLPQPFQNHNGGGIRFGPDGMLWIGTGDGGSGSGSGADPFGNGQSGATLLGKMLRLDVDAGIPYGIPVDNPFIGDPNFLDEIWAFGLRNPWRFSFDRLTGDLWIGDVGADDLEEVDFEPANTPGRNYGWSLKEGTSCFNPPTNCDPGGITTDPILEYAHDHTAGRHCIIGGVLYRGSALPGMDGAYFFCDYSSSEIFVARFKNGVPIEAREIQKQIGPGNGLDVKKVGSFGEDKDGEILILDRVDGELWTLDHAAFGLSLSPLQVGGTSTGTISGATPNAKVYLLGTFAGTGSTNIKALQVWSGLKNPLSLGSVQTDANGDGSVSFSIPNKQQWIGKQVWVQAVELKNSSSVIADTLR